MIMKRCFARAKSLVQAQNLKKKKKKKKKKEEWINREDDDENSKNCLPDS